MGKKRNTAAGRRKRRGPSDAPKVSLVRFAVTYVLAMGVLFLALALKPLQRVLDLNGLYTQLVVSVTGYFARLVGLPCQVRGSLIELPAVSLDIKFGCNGLEAVMIYGVAVAAMPLGARSRLWGVALGFVALQAVNVARLVGLAYLGSRHGELFEWVHIYIAQGMMIAVALGLFLLFLRCATVPTTGGRRTN